MVDIFSSLGSQGQRPYSESLSLATPPFLSVILYGSPMVIVIFFFWRGLCCVLVAACRFSLVAVSWGYSPVALLVLLTVMVSLVAEHGL